MFDTLFSSMKFKDAADKACIKSLFEMYMDNIPDNFYKDQFELAKEYTGTRFTDWVRILTHAPFLTWKTNQVNIIAATASDKALATGEDVNPTSLGLLKARSEMLEKSETKTKPTIIVIPSDLFFKEPD